MTLTPRARMAALERLRSPEPLDILVIGGGVVGAGAALDAVTRGLTTGLIEARDWASGTSSRSSKLVHGGLRYLEMLDFALVHEALHERRLLLTRLAPHLVRGVPFMYPLHKHAWERIYVGSGVALYDGLAFSVRQNGGLPRHRHLSKKQALKIMPSLKPKALTGAIQYYDAQVDDARLVLELVRTGAQHGVHAANRVAAVGFVRAPGGRVVGVRVRDDVTGATFEVRADRVVCATGVWSDEVQRLLAESAGEPGAETTPMTPLRVRASKGVHLVVPRDRVVSKTGVILRTEQSVLFLIPWDEHWIIGTTDTPWDLDRSHPSASSADIDYLLDTVNTVLVTPLTRDDIDGVYVGLRPLVAASEFTAESDATTRISREHVAVSPAPGVVVIAGGKLTTYRLMAKDAVDLALADLGKARPESVTEDVPLAGAVGWHELRERSSLIGRNTGIDPADVEYLLERYGTIAAELFTLVAANPVLGERLPGGEQHLKAEIVFAACCEGALHLTDVLTRRTRISIEARDRGLTAAEPAARLIAPVLGWDEDRVAAEIALYRRRVEAEMTSQEMPDDISSNEVRSQVRETFLP